MLTMALKTWRDRPLSLGAPLFLGAAHILLGVGAPGFFSGFVEKAALPGVVVEGLAIVTCGAVAAALSAVAFRVADSKTGLSQKGARTFLRAIGAGLLGTSAWFLVLGLSGGLQVIRGLAA